MNTSTHSWFGNVVSVVRNELGHVFLIAILFGLTASAFADEFPSTLSYSVDRGFYTQPFDVILSVDTSNAVMKYSLDGSDPSQSTTAKTAAAPVTIHIDPENTTDRFTAPAVCLRAVAYVSNAQVTRIKTHTYLFADKVVALSPDGVQPGAQWPQSVYWGGSQYINYGMDPDVYNDSRYKDKITDALLAIPTFSIVTDLKNLFDSSIGIYMNAFGRGEEWERPASIELICPNGDEGFQIDGGLRIRGGWSRHNYFPKHAFRLFFREEYGEKQLHYPLFGDEGASEFDKVDLRTSQNYSWANKGEGDDTGHHNTMLREVFSRDTQRDMGMPYTRSRYYHLYLNGVYWGLYQTQERSDAAYAETYFGGESEDYDVIKKDPDTSILEANDGNMDAWNQLWEIASRGFATDADYYLVQGLNPDGTRNPDYPTLVDLDNLICYMISVYYTGDYDSPISAWGGNNGINNIFAIYNRVTQDGFKFFRHDAEHTMFLSEGGIPGAAIDRTGPYSCGSNQYQFNPQWLHQQLTNHPEYRLRFSDWVYKFFFNDGALTPNAVIQRLQIRRSQIESAIIAESARWGDSMAWEPRTYDKDWVPAVEFLINDYAPVRTEMVLEQFESKNWFSDVTPPQFSHETGVVSKGEKVTITDAGGTVYYTLDGSDPDQPVTPFTGDESFGCGISASAMIYTGSIYIDKDVILKARALTSKGWSPLSEVRFWVFEDVHELRISEIHYHPLDEGDEDNDSKFEFIELQNMGTAAYDLSGLSFTRGIGYSFPSGTTLGGGEFYVLASNDTSFQLRYGFTPDGVYTGLLDNGGENLVLQKANGDTLIHIRYNDEYPWPVSADGEGYSLVVESPYPGVDLTRGESWTRSDKIHGSPKGADLATAVEESPSSEEKVSSFQLFQNYPNPFNPSTTIRFQIAKAGHVRLTIHNLLGQEVARLADGTYLPGDHQIRWDAGKYAAGLYFYRLETNGFSATKKLILIK